MTIRFLDNDYNEVVADVTMIEKSDILPQVDEYIRSIELSDGGWLELWNIDGVLCGYIEEE